MDEIVNNAMTSICYSDKDIKNLLENDVVILTYSQLADGVDRGQYRTLDDVMIDPISRTRKSAACILYLLKDNFGHWTALVKDTGGEKCFEIFDSYGLFPDDELTYIPSGYRSISNQIKKSLSLLVGNNISSAPHIPIYYNKYSLQNKMSYGTSGSINTCGRWCGMRCLLKRFNIREFIALFINQKSGSPDSIVTYLTLLNR